MRLRPVVRAALAAAGAACGHPEPFAIGPGHPGAPLGGTPVRLTVNPLPDVTPAWLLDGSGILYAATRADRFSDRCFQVLPPDGGRARTSLCYPLQPNPPHDSLHTLAWAALTPEGRVAYSATTTRRSVAGRVRQLKWGAWSGGVETHAAVAAQFSLPDGRVVDGAAYLRWLDARRFLYRADYLGIVVLCAGCPADSVISGRVLLVADTDRPDLAREVVPGTEYASSVTVLDADTIVFTRGNDSRLFRLALSGGAPTVLWDFGPGVVVRGVHAAGGRLVVLAGGSTDWVFLSSFADTVQIDRGGDLWLIERGAGTARQVNADTLAYLHPVLSPDGRRLVAESQGDLYLFALP